MRVEQQPHHHAKREAQCSSEERTGQDHRSAKIYQIDYGRCILYGFCVDACPTDAINHGHNFEWAVYTPGEMVKDKEYLLANLWREPGVKPNEKQKAKAEEVLKKHPHEPFNLVIVD
jgi:formate hydrogenlyase subunit 6/NADH:ubiquinone oxidoreductase subunit I